MDQHKKQLQEDIEGAMSLVKRRFCISDDFERYNSIYAFTNENLNGYFSRLDMPNKAILAPAGSGDYIFDVFLRKAASIETFDINRLTKYYIALKQAAIKTLDYDEFIHFFCRDFGYFHTFNHDTYQKIRKQLTEKDIIFWDALYSKWNGHKIRQSHLFFSTEETLPFLKKAVLYLQPKYYLELKRKLINHDVFSEENFKNINMKNIQQHYSKQFDIILFSNIPDYLYEIFPTNQIQTFKKWLEQDIDGMLKKDGIVCAAYLFWHYFKNRKNIPLINQQNIRDKYFKDTYEEWLIDNSSIEDSTNDKILIYRKK